MCNKTWLVFSFSQPANRQSGRVRTLRRLAGLGAAALKGGLYVLPWSTEHHEQLTWLAGEVEQGGGEAVFFTCPDIANMSHEAVVAVFCKARDEAYAVLAAEARAVLGAEVLDAREAAARLRRLTRRHEAERAIDFFDAPGGPAVAGLLEALAVRLAGREGAAAGGPTIAASDPAAYQGRLWVTRPGLYVDRLASFWLVRRCIDPQAAIAYAEAVDALPPDAVAFDMAGAPFTHVGSRITFEVMRQAFGLETAIPERLAAVIRAVDLGDFETAPPETAGVRRILDGLCAAAPSDADRLARGFDLFDALAASYQTDNQGA
jgi:hypothetical protein